MRGDVFQHSLNLERVYSIVMIAGKNRFFIFIEIKKGIIDQ